MNSHYKVSCIIVFACVVEALSAQSTWFKVHNLGDNTTESPGQIIVYNSSFYTNTWTRGYDTVNRSEALKFHVFSGDLKARGYIQLADPATNVFMRPKGFARIGGHIYAAYEDIDSSGADNVIVNKFDGDVNWVWKRTVGYPGVYVFGKYDGTAADIDSAGIILVTSLEAINTVVLWKIDTSGAVQWNVQVPDMPDTRIGFIAPIVVDQDSTFVIAYDDDTPGKEEGYVVRISRAGQILDFWKSPWKSSKVFDMVQHPNGNFILQESQRVTDETWGGMRISMLSPELDTIWTYLFTDLEFPYLILNGEIGMGVSVNAEGQIIAGSSGVSHAALLCFTPDGELLWKQEIAVEGFGLVSMGHIELASDGGILIDGYIRIDSCIEYCADIFFIKLDSLGCLTPGCTETIITSVSDVSGYGTVSLYPNPTTGMLKLDFGDDASSLIGSTVLIFNTMGTLVGSHVFDGHSEIDLTDLPAGSYVINILVPAEGRVLVGRFVRL